jgi:nitrate reductase delta subunit
MNGGTIRQRIFHLLADALEYPRPDLAKTVRECVALLASDNPEAAAPLREFCAFVEETSPGRLEELYTGTFDLDAACYPYVGYHLFGESYKRSVFMLELNERYQAHGFAVGSELPDHLAVLLRFLAVCDDAVLSEEIVHEALLPALERMDPCRGGVTSPLQTMADEPRDHAHHHDYRLVLQALCLVLQQFPANNLQQRTTPLKNSVLFTAENTAPPPAGEPAYPCGTGPGGRAGWWAREGAKEISLKAQCSQRSLRRIKAFFKRVGRHEASDQRGKKQRWLQAVCDGGNGYA